jgi:hypothetical protein
MENKEMKTSGEAERMARTQDLSPLLDRYYEQMEGSEVVEEYHNLHGTESLGILTVYDDDRAARIASHLRERIAGKVIVEIGGGIGLLACYLAQYAAQVICFEVDPAWMSCFVHVLYKKKPRNLTYVFGDARQLAMFRADIALFCTHSGHESLKEIGRLFAPEVIDVYAELVGVTEWRRSLTQM